MGRAQGLATAREHFTTGVSMGRVVVLGVVMLVGLVGSLQINSWAKAAGQVEPRPLSKPLDALPLTIGEWRGTAAYLSGAVEDILGVDQYVKRYYSSSERSFQVTLYAGYYKDIRIAKQHSPQVCYPGAGWESAGEPQRWSIVVPGRDEPIETDCVFFTKGVDRQVVLYWFETWSGRSIADVAWAKIEMIKQSLRDRDRSIFKVQIAAPVVGAEQRTRENVEAFVREFYVVLREHFPEPD